MPEPESKVPTERAQRDPLADAARKIANARNALARLGADDGRPAHLRVLTPPRG